MNATLKLNANILAYGDPTTTSNPLRRYVDWTSQRSIAVQNPKAVAFTVDPGATLTLFNNARTTSIGSGTEFALTLSTLASDRYRFTWDGTGANPAFRADRALTLNTRVVQMTANANMTVTMVAQAGDFTAVVVGDTVFLPDPSTGDAASPFSALNTGYWQVLSKATDSGSVQLARPVGASFSGATETVTVTSNAQVQAFSAAGVQVGDSVRISAGFAASVLGTYTVLAVNPVWFEVISTLPLPISATAIPGVGGVTFYTDAKRYLRIEADQYCLVQLNGDTGATNDITPIQAGDPDQMGWNEKFSTVYAASVVNMSSAPMNVVVVSAE